MNGTARFLSGFLSAMALCATGCSSDSDIHQAGTPSSGQCPVGIASTPDANNNLNVLNNGAMSGDYGGPDGQGMFSSVCIHLGGHNQALQVVLTGRKPGVGVSYDVGTDQTSTAIVSYAEDNNGSLVWTGSKGSVKITTAAKDTVGFSFDSVTLLPDASKPNNTAAGELTISGSATASDVLGFLPGAL